MSQWISRYLVDWDVFTQMWIEEENPQDALEHAEPFRTGADSARDAGRLGDLCSSLRSSSTLGPIVSNFSPHGPNPFRDLDDSFAYGWGGFSVVAQPSSVIQLVTIWREVPWGEISKEAAERYGAEAATELRMYLTERMEILRSGAENSKGYVALTG